MPDYWYIRVKGQTSGPFDQSQIDSFVRRQRLGRLDEVSLDKVTWRRAAEFPELFPAAVTKKVRKPPPVDQSESPTSESYATRDEVEIPLRPQSKQPSDWFFAANGVQSAPISFPDLRQMLFDGRVLLTDPVWTEGMVDWVPAGQLAEFGVQVPIQLQAGHAHDQPRPVMLGTAIASLVLGFLGLTILFGIAGILAVVFGHLALGQIKQYPDRYSGKGPALAGMIMGYVAIGLMLILLIVLLITGQAVRSG